MLLLQRCTLHVAFRRYISTKIIQHGITVTHKKFVDMPPSFTTLDGIVRAPLPPFDGGIAVKPRIRKLIEKATADGEQLLETTISSG